MYSRSLSCEESFSRKGGKAQRMPQRMPQRMLLGARQTLRLPLRLCAFAGVIFFCSCANQNPQTITTAAAQPITRPAGVLRVCADPNNLPFSNERGEGFENKIAQLLAQDLGERVEYTWWAQRRGFFRE